MFYPDVQPALDPLNSAPPAVLVVDDETGVRDLMSRWLATGGYTVATAGSADEALEQIRGEQPAVALCDIRMPGKDGLWLAQQIRRNAPETAVIMATGVQDVGSAVTSLRQGVVDYLTKPFGRDRLRESVLRGLEWHRAALESRRWRETLDSEMNARKRRLADAITALRIDTDEAVDGLLSMLTLSDRDAYAHAHRVASLCGDIARALEVPRDDIAVIERAALVHDLGKLALPDAILRKPASLTVEESALVRHHPTVAYELIRGIPHLATAADLVRDAHERVDGLGYPGGVSTVDVAIGARIIGVADAYDAMTRPRVFRDPISPREARLEITRCAGTQFDPVVVEAFRRIVQP